MKRIIILIISVMIALSCSLIAAAEYEDHLPYKSYQDAYDSGWDDCVEENSFDPEEYHSMGYEEGYEEGFNEGSGYEEPPYHSPSEYQKLNAEFDQYKKETENKINALEDKNLDLFTAIIILGVVVVGLIISKFKRK